MNEDREPEESDIFKEFSALAGGADAPPPSAPQVSADAKLLRGPINVFIQKVNALVAKVFEQEKENGTRTDLMVTLVMGGLSFTVANVYHMITRTLGVKMEKDEFRSTFMGMFDTAMNDIEKHKDD